MIAIVLIGEMDEVDLHFPILGHRRVENEVLRRDVGFEDKRMV
jgi:hypothetical protein